MTQQTIGIGTSANDGTGDPVRVAFDKVNKNFAELYDPQRRVTASPITIAAADVIINCNITSGSPTCASGFNARRTCGDLQRRGRTIRCA
jgi:hypothetical protein